MGKSQHVTQYAKSLPDAGFLSTSNPMTGNFGFVTPPHTKPKSWYYMYSIVSTLVSASSFKNIGFDWLACDFYHQYHISPHWIISMKRSTLGLLPYQIIKISFLLLEIFWTREKKTTSRILFFRKTLEIEKTTFKQSSFMHCNKLLLKGMLYEMLSYYFSSISGYIWNRFKWDRLRYLGT